MSFIRKIKDSRKAKKYGVTYENYLEYLELSKSDNLTIVDYKTLLKARELNINYEEFQIFLRSFSEVYTISRYKQYLLAKELNLTLDQYDSYLKTEYILRNDVDGYVQYEKANKLGLSSEEYTEYLDNYKDKMSLERFNEIVISRNHNLTIEQYDDWQKDYESEMDLKRFCNLVEARSLGISLEKYDDLKAAEALNLSIKQYYKYKPAREKGISLEDFPKYLDIYNQLSAGIDCYKIEDFDLVDIAHKAGYKKVYLDTSITDIPKRAFENFKNFEEIEIPWGLKYIGEYAFKNCKALKSITIPGSVEKIPRGMLEGCDNLQSIELHSGIKSVDITGWTELSSLDAIFSASSIEEFEIDKTKNYLFKNPRYLSSSNYDELGLTEIQDNLEVLEFGNSTDSIFELSDFPKLHTLILNSRRVERISKIENCPNLQTIIIGGVDTTDYYTKKGTRRKNIEYKKELNLYRLTELESSLKFLLIKDDLIKLFGGIKTNKEGNYDYPYYSNLTWLHTPKETEYIDIDGPLKFLSVSNKSVIDLPKKYSTLHFNYSLYNDVEPILMKNCEFFGKKCDMWILSNSLIYKIKSSYHNSSYGKRESETYFPRHHDCDELLLFYGVTKIKAEEFESYNMKTLVIPRSVTEIEDNAFLNCKKLEKVIFKGTPKKVSKNAFKGCNKLTEIEAPDLMKIRELTRLNVIDLSSLTVPPKMYKNELPEHFFDGSGIEELVIPKNVKIINSKAFANSKRLTKIVFKGKLEKIATDAFEGCENVETIVWGDNQIFNIAGKTGFPSIKEINLPEGIVHIEDHSFKNWGLESIKIPKSVESIGNKAFANCKNLSSIDSSEFGEFIVRNNYIFAEDSFIGCNIFNSVVFMTSDIGSKVSILDQLKPRIISIMDDISPSDFNEILCYESIEINCLKTENKIMFDPILNVNNCPSSLERIELPKCVQYVSDDFFRECVKLEYLKLADKTLIIDDEAFDKCISLKEISASQTIYALNDIFSNFNEIVKVYGDKDYPQSELYLDNNENEVKSMSKLDKALVSKVIVSFNIKHISSYLFSDFYNLKEVVFEGDILSIGEFAFKDCVKLNKIQIPNSVVEIGKNAFERCNSLKTFRVSDNLTKLNVSLFKDCKNLKFVSNLLNIGYVKEGVFENCKNLKELVFSKEIFSIESAFEGCLSLEKLIIPVDIAVFKVDLTSCKSLKLIYLPREIDEFFAKTNPKNNIIAYAKRGSSWKDYFEVHKRKFLKIADYDNILKNELSQAGLITDVLQERDSVTKTNIHTPQNKNNIKNFGPAPSVSNHRATWDTRSRNIDIGEKQNFDTTYENLDSFIKDLGVKQKEYDYEVENVKRIDSINNLANTSVKGNCKIKIVSDNTIRNNIFTIKLHKLANIKVNELFIILVDASGKSMSSMKKISCNKINDLSEIETQLELKSNVRNQEYKIVVATQNPIEDFVISIMKVKVDIAFSLDFGF